MMTAGRFKSRSFRRVKKRMPSGRVKTTYTRRKPKKARCAICGKELHGVPRVLPSELKKYAKSQKRPSRPYGGYICSSCLRKLMKGKARATQK